jgi:hypothetical protein
MRIAKTIGIILFVPVLGVVAGFATAGFLLRHEDPFSVALGGGFLIILCAIDGFLFSIPISVLLAIWSWRRTPKNKTAN